MSIDLEARDGGAQGARPCLRRAAGKLGKIAKANGMSAMDLYMLVKPLERPVEAAPAALRYTAEMVEERFEGKGIGRKTVAEMAAEAGVDAGTVATRLEKAGIAADGRTLKALADAHRMTPVDMLKIMLVADDKGG